MTDREKRIVELTVQSTLEALIVRADIAGEWEMWQWLQDYLDTVTRTIEG